MRRTSQPSPAQLASLTGLGGLLAASSLFVISNPWTPAHHRSPHFLLFLLLATGLLVAGGVIAYRSASALELGIVNERWAEPEIESLRDLLRSDSVLTLSLLLLLGFIVFAVILPHHRSAGWSLNVVLLTLNFLRLHIPAKPSPPSDSTWGNLSPIRSDHWGHPSD